MTTTPAEPQFVSGKLEYPQPPQPPPETRAERCLREIRNWQRLQGIVLIISLTAALILGIVVAAPAEALAGFTLPHCPEVT